MALLKTIVAASIIMLVPIAVASIIMSLPYVDPKEVDCLSKNIYFEARSERIEGQIAVAHVTINRVNHKNWPDTICEVVYQPHQFSWTSQVADQTPHELRAYNQAKVIARDVMIGNVDDPTLGAVFYHASYVSPKWAKYLTLSRVIGRHVFYTWDGDWNYSNN